jgi:hypothetical protein
LRTNSPQAADDSVQQGDKLRLQLHPIAPEL